MQYELTEEQEMLRETVRRVAIEKIEPGAEERDEKGEFDWETAKLLAENGLFGIDIALRKVGVTNNIILRSTRHVQYFPVFFSIGFFGGN